MPRAFTIASASSPRARPAPAAPPKGALVPGPWKPRSSSTALVAAAPTRHASSYPAATAAMKDRPSRWSLSAMASAAGKTAALGWQEPRTKAWSVSKPPIMVPLTSAA